MTSSDKEAWLLPGRTSKDDRQKHLEQYLALIERKADSDLDPY